MTIMIKKFFAAILLFLLLPAVAVSQQNTDTISFRLTANNENGVALLHWSDLGAGVSYDVYRHLPQETSFQLLLSTDTVEIYDTIARSVCHDTVIYYVTAWKHDTFCLSNRMSLFFDDPNPTTGCRLGLASVDRVSQRLVLTWQPSPDEDVMGYVIHKGTNGSRQGSLWMAYDTVYGKNNTRYVCSGLNLAEINAFRIYAFDSCFQASPLTSPYQNIVLHAEVPECSRQLSLRWTSYINMPSEVATYEVLVQQDEEAWQTIAVRNIHQTLDYSYELSAACRQAKVVVCAVSADLSDTAWSNMVTLQLKSEGSIGYLSLDKVSVADNNQVALLTASADSTFLVDAYSLYRHADGGEWALCARLPFTGRGVLHYADHTAAPSSVRYSYRLGVADGCRNGETFSNTADNILLQMSTAADNENMVHLEWNDYSGWNGGVRYELLRRKESDTQWQSLGSMTAHSCDDDLSALGNLSEALLYKVVAHGADTLQSNSVRYAREVRLWIPNAFTPTAETNALFCIQNSFLGAEGYELFIFTRTGQQIYHTTRVADCWDGRLNGELLPQGAYVYLVNYRDAQGKIQSVKGTVLLLQ